MLLAACGEDTCPPGGISYLSSYLSPTTENLNTEMLASWPADYLREKVNVDSISWSGQQAAKRGSKFLIHRSMFRKVIVSTPA